MKGFYSYERPLGRVLPAKHYDVGYATKEIQVEGTTVSLQSWDGGRSWHSMHSISGLNAPTEKAPTALSAPPGPSRGVPRLRVFKKRSGGKETRRTSEDYSPKKKTLRAEAAQQARLRQTRPTVRVDSASVANSGYATNNNRQALERIIMGALGRKKSWLQDIKES